MCKSCRLNCRGIRFDFQCKKFYHDYCTSSAYLKPDLICFFNPSLHRPGFRGFETWPKTIKCATSTNAAIVVTSPTENENLLDLQRIESLTSDESVKILLAPQKNPYASSRPERSFSDNDDISIMFKNNFLFVLSDKNLIEF
jgi:mitochondrial splicing suppressor protein 51